MAGCDVIRLPFAGKPLQVPFWIMVKSALLTGWISAEDYANWPDTEYDRSRLRNTIFYHRLLRGHPVLDFYLVASRELVLPSAARKVR